MSKLICVTGGQFGSEAKGTVTAHLADREIAAGHRTCVIRVAGPNAGHTAYDDNGKRWALRQIPAAVVNPDAHLLIAAGSEIDFDVLVGEIVALENAGFNVRGRLIVDGQATMITDSHRVSETALVTNIGSTGKGIGAARSDRLMRTARLASDDEWLLQFNGAGIDVMDDTDNLLWDILRKPNDVVIIEGTQGYGLGLHAGFYPKCTSSDCRAIDFLAMAGIDPHWADVYQCWVVARTHPIRVAGNSGPLMGETTWGALGLEPEKTTVTHKIRRVGAWDPDLVQEAVRANGGPGTVRLALTMADHVVPKIAGAYGDPVHAAGHADDQAWGDLMALVERVETDTGAKVGYVGTGPNTCIDWG